MDVRDRGHEAHRIDPRGVRESGGAAEERKPDRRRAVQSKQIERLVGPIDIPDTRGGRLHFDDDRQQRERAGGHHGLERRVDLLGCVRQRPRGWQHRDEGEGDQGECAAEADQPHPHADRSTARSMICSSASGSVKLKVLP